MELSKTAYVILGMLRTRAHTGYEIKSIVDHSTRFFWAASYGQIYPELKRLEAAGADVRYAELPGGHHVDPRFVAGLGDWLTDISA